MNDHSELKRLAEAARQAKHDAENAPTCLERANARRAQKDLERLMGSKTPALLAEIAALRVDLSRKHDACQIAQDQAMENGSRATQAERQRDALIGYTAHDDDCTVNRFPGHEACSCGLSSILQRARHEQIAENANCSPTDFFAENAKNPPPAGEE